ncbi:MAG: C25 family cysteine peptidase [Salinivirgaceae bacterium]|nr:C25 family cysteine peptidase [Salinivirgaceae bacterium]
MKKLLIFGVLSIFMINSNFAQTRISVKPGESELRMVQSDRAGFSVVNNVAYIDVQLEKFTKGANVELLVTGYGNSFNIGNPDLPVLNRLIEIPLDAEVEVKVIGYSEVVVKLSDYDINKVIAPSQESVSKSADPDKIPYVKNELVYEQDAWFSNPIARIHESGTMRGVRIGRLEINPLAYNPVTGELKIYNDLKIEVSFKNANISKTDNYKKRFYSPAFTGLMSGLLNYNSVTRDLNINGAPMKFVIISHRMFESTLTPFIAWKKKQGFETILRFTDEPEVGGTPTAIKAYLQGLYDAGTVENPAPSFVMLVGDHEQVPAFSGSATNDSHVSDLYFGTYDGPSDLLPDVNLGRMSAKSIDHLEPLIQKTLLYEQFQMADPSYLANTLLIAGVDGSYATVYGNGALNYSADTYFNAAHGINPTNIPYPASNGSGVPAQIIATVNTGIAWGNYTAHCSPAGWADPSFVTSSISSLNNEGRYGLLIGNCCQSSQFNNDVCFAEAITRAANKGAIGYIGGTNSTYWSEDYWWATGFGTVVQNPNYANFGPGAYDALFHEHLANDDVYSTTQSQIVTAGMLAVEASNSPRKRYYWEIYHLMGDPTLTPYVGAVPAMLPSYLETIPMGMNSITISNVPAKAYVALTDNGEIKATGFASASGSIELVFEGFTVPTTADIVITAPFNAPFIGTLDIIPSNAPFVVYFGYTINDEQGNNNGLIDYDETIQLGMDLRNVGTVNATNVTVVLRTDNPYITLIDSIQTLDGVNAETTETIIDAFSFSVSKDVPDQESVSFTVVATDETNEPWVTSFKVLVNAPALEAGVFAIEEIAGNGNGRIDADETIRIAIPVANIGNAAGFPMTAMLTSSLVDVTVTDIIVTSEALDPESTTDFVFVITTGTDIAVGTPLTLNLMVNSDIFSFETAMIYSVGLQVEDFESGDFAGYEWVQGEKPWVIENTGAYGGTYCAKSGAITHYQNSEISITMNVSSADEISFYRKVSSENTYDKLHFSINGQIANNGTWSGNQSWELVTFPVAAGETTFSWKYIKDVSVSGGSDCAWIDNITFPGSAVIINSAPTFTSDDVDSARVNQLYTAIVSATDPDNDPLTFVATKLPDWMTLEDNGDGTALLSGTPLKSNALPKEQAVITVSDGMFLATKVININVNGFVGINTAIQTTQLNVYPNPTNGVSTLTYSLMQGNPVMIDIYNLNGQRVKGLLNQPMTAGEHQMSINFEGLASGVYVIRLLTGKTVDNLYIVVK